MIEKDAPVHDQEKEYKIYLMKKQKILNSSQRSIRDQRELVEMERSSRDYLKMKANAKLEDKKEKSRRLKELIILSSASLINMHIKYLNAITIMLLRK